MQAFTKDGAYSLQNFLDVLGDWKIALTNTPLLTAIVVPVQLAPGILMATMVNEMQRGREIALYVWTIPLGISDLAAGIIWLAIFEQSGFLNSMLGALGVIDRPSGWLTYQHPGVIFAAIAL